MARPSQPSPVGPRRVLSAQSLLDANSLGPMFTSREGGSKASPARLSQVHGKVQTPLNMYEGQPTMSSHSLDSFNRHVPTSPHLQSSSAHPAYPDDVSSMAVMVYNPRHQQRARHVTDVDRDYHNRRHRHGSPVSRHEYRFNDDDDDRVAVYQARHHHHHHQRRHNYPDDDTSLTSDTPHTHHHHHHHYYFYGNRGPREGAIHEERARFANGQMYSDERRGGEVKVVRYSRKRKWWQTEEGYETVKPSIGYFVLKVIEVLVCLLIVILTRVGADDLDLDLVYTIFGFIGLTAAVAALMLLWVKGHPVPGYLLHSLMLLVFAITVPLMLTGAILALLEPDPSDAYVALTAALFLLAMVLFTWDLTLMTVSLLRCTCLCLQPPPLRRRRGRRSPVIVRSPRTHPITDRTLAKTHHDGFSKDAHYPHDYKAGNDYYYNSSGENDFTYSKSNRNDYYGDPARLPYLAKNEDARNSPEGMGRGYPKYPTHKAALPPAYPHSRPKMNIEGRSLRYPRHR